MATAPATLLPAGTSPTGSITGGLMVAGIAATLIGGSAPVAFALAAVLAFGMLHGISDLALIAPGRRGSFLLAYLLLAGATLALWRVLPTVALLLFLLASMLHFGIEDAPTSRPGERLCRGLLMVAAPALLHQHAISIMFDALVGTSHAARLLTVMLAVMAGAGLLLLPIAWSEKRREHDGGTVRCAVALGALLLLSPLVGFSIAFVTLHAWPELRERMAERGQATIPAYLVAHWPVALGAGLVVGAAGWLFADRVALPLAMLFAGIAALAIPHMVVTPLWRRRQNGG